MSHKYDDIKFFSEHESFGLLWFLGVTICHINSKRVGKYCRFKNFYLEIYHLKVTIMKSNYLPNVINSCIKSFLCLGISHVTGKKIRVDKNNLMSIQEHFLYML